MFRRVVRAKMPDKRANRSCVVSGPASSESQLLVNALTGKGGPGTQARSTHNTAQHLLEDQNVRRMRAEIILGGATAVPEKRLTKLMTFRRSMMFVAAS